MIINQTDITASQYAFDLTANIATTTVSVQEYDGSTWTEVDSIVVTNGTTEEHIFTVDGLYRFTYTESAVVYYYLVGIDIEIRNALMSLAGKVINNSSIDDIKNYNSFNLSVLMLYNLLPEDYREVIFTNFSGNIPVTTIQNYLVVFERIQDYCETLLSDTDCDCS